MPAWVLTEGADNFPVGGPPPPDDWKNTGADQVFGLGGDDFIDAGLLDDTVSAGDGNDEVRGGDGLDILLGGNGNDTLSGDDGDDSVSGEVGADIIHGNAGDDGLSGGADGDTLFGDDGADTINGDDGNDTISGGLGNDTIYTGAGSDTAHGNGGNDTFGAVSDAALAGDADRLFGDGGNDLLIAKGRPVDGWTARFDGGSGTDTVRAGNDIRHYSFANVEVLQATNLIMATAEQFNQFSLFTDINAFSDVTSLVITTAGTVDFSARLDTSITKLAVTGSFDGNTIIGGAGDDLLRGYVYFIGEAPGPTSVHLEGRGGNDNLQGSDGDDYLDGGTGADDMSGFGGNNIYIVDNVGDVVRGGGAGVDEMRTSLNSFDGTTAWGGHLIDKVVFTGSGDFHGILSAHDGTIVGGAGNDTLTGASGGMFDGAQTFIGGGGNDTITGANDRPDTADYSTATTTVRVSLAFAGAQNTGASTGRDTLSGIENLRGSDFSDRLTGDGAANRLDGGSGNDIIIGGAGGDTLIGGLDTDTLSYAGSALGVTVNLRANSASGGDAAGDIISGFERVIGSVGDDTLTGSSIANILTGGLGRDLLKGGLGNDIFDFNAITESTVAAVGRDLIADFNEAAADRIDLSTIDANSVLAFNNAFTFIGAAAFTALGQVRAYASGTNTIVDINTTDTNATDMRIMLTGIHVLDATDFIL